MIWRTGIGRTAPSRLVVRKSQKILGQKKPSRAAATWSVVGRKMLVGWRDREWEKGTWLTGCSGEDDQSCPVVLDELAHDV